MVSWMASLNFGPFVIGIPSGFSLLLQCRSLTIPKRMEFVRMALAILSFDTEWQSQINQKFKLESYLSQSTYLTTKKKSNKKREL